MMQTLVTFISQFRNTKTFHSCRKLKTKAYVKLIKVIWSNICNRNFYRPAHAINKEAEVFSRTLLIDDLFYQHTMNDTWFIKFTNKYEQSVLHRHDVTNQLNSMSE